MIVCPSCEYHNAEGSRTCAACGASMAGFVYRVCPSCGALSPAQNTYCNRCLAELVPVSDAAPKAAEQSVTPFQPAEPLASDLLEVEPAARSRRKRTTGAAAPAPEPAGPSDQASSEPAPAEQATAAAQVEPQAPAPPEAVAPAEVTARSAEDAARSPEAAARSPETATPPAAQPSPALDLSAPLPSALANEALRPESLLPLEAPVTLPHRAQTPAYGAPGETEQYDADLFARIATQPAPLSEAANAVLPRQSQVLSGAGRAVLYVLVLLAALAPVFTGGRLSGAFASVQPSAQVTALAAALTALPENAHVLVAVDYEPAYAGELDPLALAVLRHLAERQANLLLVSTKPAGMGVAERLMATVAGESATYQTYGERYVLGGYLAGQEAGLRTLSSALAGAFVQDYRDAQPLSQWAATRDLSTVADLAGIIVLSDDSQAVRRWIEQVQSRTQLPLYALVTARILPLLQPYVGSGQLGALLGGAAQAAEYGVASTGSPQPMRHSDAYLALLGVLLLVLVVTNVAGLAHKRVARS